MSDSPSNDMIATLQLPDGQTIELPIIEALKESVGLIYVNFEQQQGISHLILVLVTQEVVRALLHSLMVKKEFLDTVEFLSKTSQKKAHFLKPLTFLLMEFFLQKNSLRVLKVR